MDFSISKEQRELLDRLDEFCEANLDEWSIQEWLSDGVVSDAFMLKYSEAGFGPIGYPERMGGIPSTVLTRTLILERLAYHAAATLPMQGSFLSAQIVSHLANDRQMDIFQRYLHKTGKLSFSFAVSEPTSGSNTLDTQTVAVEDEDGDGFVIDGVKTFVNFGQYAPYIVLLAYDDALGVDPQTGHKQLSFFLVPRDAPGVDVIPVSKIGQLLIPSAEIVLNDVRVGKEAVIGPRGVAASVVLDFFEYGRLYLCATSVGMAQAALRQAVKFALHRSLSGTSIMSYQQIQEMLVDMQIKVDSMRCMLYRCACEFDVGGENTRLDTALLKRYVPRTAMEVADAAMQVMGSTGYLSTTRAARVWQECRGNRLAEGTDQVMTVIAAKRIARAVEEDKDFMSSWWL